MRNTNPVGLAALFLVACAGQEPSTSSNELGLAINQLDDSHVAGRMTTMVGSVDFVATETVEGEFEIRFDRGNGQFGTSVNWNDQTADFAWPSGMQITDDDRFVLGALSLAIEAEVGKTTRVTDNLFRQSALWGAHPVGEIVLAPIVGDPARGYTVLCSAGACNSSPPSRSFSHSGGGTERSAPCGSHAGTTKSHSRPFGKADGINPCNARCGAGCGAVGTSTYTQDCGNHDICEYWHTSDCGGELTSASDDYTLAPNCSC
jgi:hypothetical protein